MADTATPGDGNVTQPAPNTPAPNAPAPQSDPNLITMTQEQLNAKLAGNKRTLQSQLTEAQRKANAFDALQGQVSELLESGIIDGVEDLDGFRDAAASTLQQFQTEKETLERQNAATEKKLTAAQKLAEETRQKYEQSLIQRQISDDAADLVVEGQGREGAIEYFQLKLSQNAQVDEQGNVGVKWSVTDPETGNVEQKVVPVSEALKSMEAEPSKYGRYFKSTVNGGTGTEPSLDGVKRTADGGIDFSAQTGENGFQQFMELRSKNPSALTEAANKLSF